ncbi:MAG: taurine ABC transporter substrate-binding protein, partial [Microcystis panniformis]
MPLKRREILLGLLGASLPLVVSSCVSEKTGSSSNPSSTTATAPAATGTLPEKIRIGYQVIPNPVLLAKALGLAD